MIVYIAIQTGVYRHAILGVYESESEAVAKGTEFIATEGDHYHQVDIVQMVVGKWD